MKNRKFSIRSEVWLYPGIAGWHFVSLTKKQSDEITKRFGEKKKGWGSLPVTVTLGEISWNTSIFPDRREGVYLLPLKAKVRKSAGISYGDMIHFLLEIRV